ncbi:glycosyltransferase family 4 protein [Pollutibacter soli]|uniref:glycosyltransferase family 4 protein n=1 Tax=Pollutibacter soli TaxID=3034157 RepID=UPI0030132C78
MKISTAFAGFYIPLRMEQKKKIAFVSNTLWSIFRFRFSLIRQLLKDDYNVLVVAPEDNTRPHFDNIENLEFVPLRHLKQGFSSPWGELKLKKELEQVYLQHNPDLVFHYTIKPNIFGTLAARSAGIPCIAVVTGMGYAFINSGILGLLVIPLYRNAARKANQVWFLNEGDKIHFIRKGIIRRTPSLILPGEGIDTEKFQPMANNSREPEKIRFLMIARLLNNKGVREFVSAAAQVKSKFPDIEFTIAGSYDPSLPDSIPEELFNQISDGKRISYVSQSQDIRNEIRQADAVVLPSYAEGLSMSLMEAAAMEKPLIATNVSGCRELVMHGISGYLCEVKNAHDLAEKMIRFIQLPAENKLMMGKNGRKLMIEKFDLKEVIHIYKENIRQLLP